MVIIPAINLTDFTNCNPVTRQALIKQIYEACHEIGFMYLENSGISKDLIKQVFTQSKSFFNLPLEVKQKQAWSDEFNNTGFVIRNS
jgi:isopenicillin N synthase-like dioxygenase